MTIGQFFYEHPVFRLEEFVAWKQQHGSTTKKAIKSLLQYYINTGRLLRIRRELYAVVPANATPESVSVDAYLVAGKVAPDSVLGLHTALELFGMAYSSFEQLTYFSERKTKPFEFQYQWFQPLSTPINLRRKKEPFFEVETINRQGVDVRISSLARTFVDCLDRVELAGGWEEVLRSIDNIAVLDYDRVIAYCQLLDNAILAAKVGYVLQQLGGVLAPSSEQLQALQALKPSTPQYVSKKREEPYLLIKKWNIMMPERVINRNWEEPDHEL